MFSAVAQFDDKYKVNGESTIPSYQGWVDLIDVDHRLDLPMTIDKSSNSRTAGRAVHGPLVVTMLLNKAYPKLIEGCAAGRNFGKVNICLLRTNEGKPVKFATFALTDTFIASVELDGASTADADNVVVAPHVQVVVKLDYASISVEYSEYDNSGTNKGAVSSGQIQAVAAVA